MKLYRRCSFCFVTDYETSSTLLAQTDFKVDIVATMAYIVLCNYKLWHLYFVTDHETSQTLLV